MEHEDFLHINSNCAAEYKDSKSVSQDEDVYGDICDFDLGTEIEKVVNR